MTKTTHRKKTLRRDLDGLRDTLSRKAEEILNYVWDYHWKNSQWPSALTLYSKFEKASVLSALEPLGGHTIYSAWENGQEIYRMMFLGVLLTRQGIEAEDLIVSYLALVRDRFLTNPENIKITSQEIESALSLTSAQSFLLNRLLQLSFFFGGGGGVSQKEGDPWYINLPQDVADFPRNGDLRGYFKRRVMENYNPEIPITEGARAMFVPKGKGTREKLFQPEPAVYARIQSAFENLELHQQIAKACSGLYRDGHYRNAVSDAAVALTNMVKAKSQRHDIDGANLMRTVFSKNNPILVFNNLKDQSDLDEQEGRMHIFEGVIQGLRNPRAHNLSNDSPEEALEYIGLLSLLAKWVDQAKRKK